MVAGRPRTSSFEKEEMINLGKELVQWVTEETDEFRFLFSQFYSIKMGILRKDWKAMVQAPEFLPYYEQAQAALALKCLNETVKEGFGHRYLRLYDRELVEEENEQKKFESELRKKENSTQTVPEDYKKDFHQMMQCLKDSQSLSF